MATLTIIIPSYNKEQYISEALDSIFMQETTYSYKIIIADDCSTDNTIQIIKQYQEKYPDKIKLLTSESNQKLYRNVLRAYAITKSDYFCVLDPDDYWIDKKKIQKSLDFLEKNKDYTIYITNTIMQFPNGNQETYIKTRKTTNSTFQDFLENKATLGCTLGSMFRNVIFKHGIPEKMKNLETSTQEVSFRGDTFRSIIHLNKGKAHYEPQCDAIYRITNIGIWQSLSEIERNIQNAQVYLDLYLFFDEKYQQLLLKSYRLFRLSEKSLVSSLSKIEDENKKIRIIQTLEKLNSVYSENQIIVNKKKYKRLPIKYKIMYYLYKKLYKKLDKAGFLILE